MKVLIVEDEKLLAKRLQKMLLETEPSAEVTAITRGVEETVNYLNEHPAPDLILMDIELADGQSFDIFKACSVTSPVIFTTAYNEYAIKAFKVNSVDYLLKPVKEEELKAALDKYKKVAVKHNTTSDIESLITAIKNIQQPANYRERFLVKQGAKLMSIEITDVAYFFSEGGYSFIRTKDNQKFILDYSMDEIEKMVPPKKFFRANRQYILSNACVAAIHTWFNQKLKVEIKPVAGEHVVISRDKANAFKEWMGE